MAVKRWTRQLNFPQLGTYLNYSISETATLPRSRVLTASTQEVIQCTISLPCAKYGVDNWITLATKCVALAKKRRKNRYEKKFGRRIRFSNTEPYKFINEERKWIKRSRMCSTTPVAASKASQRSCCIKRKS